MTSIDSSHNKYDVSYNIKENDLKRSDLKPKRTLLQKIIKLHIFFCVQVTTILVATLIASRFYKC
jgi:hypothetical protein